MQQPGKNLFDLRNSLKPVNTDCTYAERVRSPGLLVEMASWEEEAIE